MSSVDYPQALTCARLSREVYNDLQGLHFTDLDSAAHPIEDLITDTQGAIATDPNRAILYIVFRGSTHEKDWEINSRFRPTAAEFRQVVIQEQIVEERQQTYPYNEGGSSGALMHSGFVESYMSVRSKVHQYLNAHNGFTPTVIVTGHSLGGAIATLCAVDVQYNFSDKITGIALYSFGAPRVGNRSFQESFNRRVPNSYRFVYGMDMVPALPRPWQGYVHIDQEQHLGSRFGWRFLSRRFTDHDINQYIAAIQGQLP
jgi:triacylglycerol lipase